ncbi:hypothetical protein [Kitasatospora sp. McL0602]|uniref:hypothetical protein n=1 Tax=Kitasatospora sp. McL0602 TaxID=3439530 RepID=UPI003F8CE6DC
MLTLSALATLAVAAGGLLLDGQSEHLAPQSTGDGTVTTAAVTPGLQLNGCGGCWPSAVAAGLSWEHLDLNTGGDVATGTARFGGWQPDWNDVAPAT